MPKKRPSVRSRARPRLSPTSSPSLRSVSRSSAPSTTETARRLGVHPSTLRRWALIGRVHALVDSRGYYHFPSSPKLSRTTASPPKTPVVTARSPSKRKKRGKRGKAPRRKKKRPSPPTRPRPLRPPSGPLIRHVRSSSAPSIADAATHFGVSVRTVLGWIDQRLLRATLSADGVLRIPALALQSRELERKRRLQEKRKKAAKKKRVRKTPSRRQRIIELFESELTPRDILEHHRDDPEFVQLIAPLFQTSPDLPEVTPDRPLDVERAIEKVSKAMAAFVMARPEWQRVETGATFHLLKSSFKAAYGEKKWKDAYAYIVDEYGLDDYIFEFDALRDS